jgi:hypothetical protein
MNSRVSRLRGRRLLRNMGEASVELFFVAVHETTIPRLSQVALVACTLAITDGRKRRS